MAKKKTEKTIQIEQVKSPIGFPRNQREVLRSLGLRRIRHVVVRQDTPAVRGMVRKIPHLVRIVEEAS
ncbi:MAG TPA: 50S ribosomal protein L30 [Thermoanaerobaculia bacterium]|jgi:large subunit ribosomal protein L30